MKYFKTYKEAAGYAKELARKHEKTLKVIKWKLGFAVENVPIPNEIEKEFTDSKNFPYGFDRSGDFTSIQANLLKAHGQKIMYIQNDAPKEIDDEDLKNISAIFDKIADEQKLVIAWNKYQSIVNKKPVKMFTGKGGHIAVDEDGCSVAHATIVPRGHLTQKRK